VEHDVKREIADVNEKVESLKKDINAKFDKMMALLEKIQPKE
jgi:hypothetical protein